MGAAVAAIWLVKCSVDVQGSLLAAGGKNGHAAVFGIDQAMVSSSADLQSASASASNSADL